jgi:hypothetical protein
MQDVEAEADMLRGRGVYEDGVDEDHAIPEAEGETWPDDEMASDDDEMASDDDEMASDPDKADDDDKAAGDNEKVAGDGDEMDNQEMSDAERNKKPVEVAIPAARHTLPYRSAPGATLLSAPGRTSCQSLLHRSEVARRMQFMFDISSPSSADSVPKGRD